MASGNFVGNLINWYIGQIIMAIYYEVGVLFGLFGIWSFGHDGLINTANSWKPAGVSTDYSAALTLP